MDLNILISNCGEKNSREVVIQKVRKAYELGYELVALNTFVDFSCMKDKDIEVPAPVEITLEEIGIPEPKIGNRMFKLLSRLTVKVADGIHCHRLMQFPATIKYDLLAVQPTSEKMLQHVCGNLDVELVSLDFSQKLSYSLKRTYIGQAAEKGMLFEIQYAPCLRDQGARRSVICNSQILVNVAKGKDIVLSSGAWLPLEIRSVLDVSNLALLFGLKENESKDVVRKNCNKVVAHALTRRKTGCGFLSVEEISHLLPQDKWLVNVCRIPKAEEKSLCPEANDSIKRKKIGKNKQKKKKCL